MDEHDRFRGCLLGLACGDAVGTAVEFTPRGKFPPVTDMVGGGVFGLKPGEWTDDTSMALCLASSLTELGRFDPKDQLERYWQWVEEGYWSSNGRCFDVGNTVYDALERFRQTGEPFSGSTDPWSAGNGCIMR
ncbi:MAG: ADP-ribosylglycohydrolase family protein, partial [Planctomycetes bacterium]|nr:ADP-ribosylglycohydrolase family protein [Planctomycetota bacterium]